jgi:hypothetical protein
MSISFGAFSGNPTIFSEYLIKKIEITAMICSNLCKSYVLDANKVLFVLNKTYSFCGRNEKFSLVVENQPPYLQPSSQFSRDEKFDEKFGS